MSKGITLTQDQLDQARSRELEDNTDFTLEQHLSERITFHKKMLNYYRNELTRLRFGEISQEV